MGSMIAPDVELGPNVVVHHPDQVNLFGCKVGDNCKIASFVEIQRGVVLGRNVKIEPFVFIPTGVTIEDGVFVGPHVCFSNDRYPSAVDDEGKLLEVGDWQVVPTLVRRRASIGANATIICGITIGEGAMVGAGATVTHDVPPDSLVVGNPARLVGPRPRWWSRPPRRARERKLELPSASIHRSHPEPRSDGSVRVCTTSGPRPAAAPSGPSRMPFTGAFNVASRAGRWAWASSGTDTGEHGHDARRDGRRLGVLQDISERAGP